MFWKLVRHSKQYPEVSQARQLDVVQLRQEPLNAV